MYITNKKDELIHLLLILLTISLAIARGMIKQKTLIKSKASSIEPIKGRTQHMKKRKVEPIDSTLDKSVAK